MNLANKYRPKTFNDVVGQKDIITVLRHQLKTKTHKNAYLFTGGAGTGKTTTARILANELNNHKGSPFEIDAASNNGVDNIRQIIEESKFKALDTHFRVYILDEVHMLSIGAWNALLKLLEEPNPLTIFILCTTDPQKIPPTIISRVQRFDYQRLSVEEIFNRLTYILKTENIEYSNDAIDIIAKLAEGGLRDSITLLDKCISYGELNTENVAKCLGVTAIIDNLKFIELYLSKQTTDLMELIETIHLTGKSLKTFISGVLNTSVDVFAVYKKQDVKTNIPEMYKNELSDIIKKVNNQNELVLLVNNLIKLKQSLNGELYPRYAIQAWTITTLEG